LESIISGGLWAEGDKYGGATSDLKSSPHRKRAEYRTDIQFWATFGQGFSNYMSEEAWNNGRPPAEPLTPALAGFTEVFKHWLENKEFEYNPWRPWPIEYYLEPYLYDKNLEGIGDWPNPDSSQCPA
jgi:hypothetical protein